MNHVDYIGALKDEVGLSPEQLSAVTAQTDEEHRKYGHGDTDKPARPLLSWEALGADLGRYLTTEPPAPEWLFTDLMRARTVGAIVATGGAGKSRLALHLMFALATGTDFGPFRPDGPKRVIYLCGEEPAEILHERIYEVSRAMGVFGEGDPTGEKGRLLLENFRPVPMVGTDRVLIAKDQMGNPAGTDTYRWLDDSLSGMGGVDLLVIDPLSRFYGLDENDNPSGTAFVACLEALVKRHRTGIIFLHHSAKAVTAAQDKNKRREETKDKGRGAGAFHDGVRLMLSICSMMASDIGVLEENETQSEFIEVKHVKANYSRAWGKPYFFQKGPGLLLSPFDPDEGIRGKQVRELVEWIPEEGVPDWEILKGKKAGTEIRAAMKQAFPRIVLERDIPLVLNLAVQEGLLEKIEVKGRNPNGKPSYVFRRPGRTTEAPAGNTPAPVQNQFSGQATMADSDAGNAGNADKKTPETSEPRRKKTLQTRTRIRSPFHV